MSQGPLDMLRESFWKESEKSVKSKPDLKSTTFVRKFRWIFESSNLDPQLICDVKFNFAKRKLQFEAYEVVINDKKDLDIHCWLEKDISKEKIKFTTHDGCGNPLYSYTFSGLELLSDTSFFNNYSSEESRRKVTLKYTDVVRNAHLKPPELISKSSVKNPKFTWQLTVDDHIINVDLQNKSNLIFDDLSNLQIWKNVKIKFPNPLDENSKQAFFKLMKNPQSVKLQLVENGFIVSEVWTLNNVSVADVYYDGVFVFNGELVAEVSELGDIKDFEFFIKYDNVFYSNFMSE